MRNRRSDAASEPRDEGNGQVVGRDRPFIAPGIYRLILVTFETHLLFDRRPKLVLRFRICDPGDHFGKEVSRWYNVVALIGHPREHGRFRVGRGSDYVLDYVTLFGKPQRLDRLPPSRFANCVFCGRIRTVDKDHRQRKLPDCLQYSVVHELSCIEVGA